MAAYRRVYDSCHLQADCQEPGSAPERYARQSSTMAYLFTYTRKLTGHGTAPRYLVIARALTSWSEARALGSRRLDRRLWPNCCRSFRPTVSDAADDTSRPGISHRAGRACDDKPTRCNVHRFESVSGGTDLQLTCFLSTFSAFAAAAPLRAALRHQRARSYRSISPAHRALSKPAVTAVNRWDRRTDGRTDAKPLHRPCSAYSADSVNKDIALFLKMLLHAERLSLGFTVDCGLGWVKRL